MVITKEKGCAAISTMVAQPFSCKASIGIGTNPMPVSFASNYLPESVWSLPEHRRNRHWRHRPLPNPEMSHWMRPPCTDGCTWGPCWNRCWPWSLAHWHHPWRSFGAGIIGIRVAVRGIAVRGVFAAIAWIHRVDDGVDELVDPGVQRVGVLGHLFGDVDYRHIGATGSASDHIGRVTGFLRVVDQHIHALVFDEFLERLQVRGCRFAAGSGRLRIPLGV